MTRGLILFALLLGQIGLPKLSLTAFTGNDCQNPSAAPGTKCQCPPALRRIGRCCCAVKMPSAKGTCCTVKLSKSDGVTSIAAKVTASAKSCCQHAPRQNSAFRDACPCGTGTDAFAYRCADPRVMPPKLALSVEQALQFVDGIHDDSLVGEPSPPPLPPPKFRLG